GVRSERAAPSDAAIAAAAAILTLLPSQPVYARIDAIVDESAGLDGRLQLMEVELIEPELFFTHAPDAADRFAAALLKRLS
ncbi:MAG: glutathione synthetase, partial [Pseudomonadota bacterium]